MRPSWHRICLRIYQKVESEVVVQEGPRAEQEIERGVAAREALFAVAKKPHRDEAVWPKTRQQ